VAPGAKLILMMASVEASDYGTSASNRVWGDLTIPGVAGVGHQLSGSADDPRRSRSRSSLPCPLTDLGAAQQGDV
jgi:hypothetical protein